jgi:hypothetical protein
MHTCGCLSFWVSKVAVACAVSCAQSSGRVVLIPGPFGFNIATRGRLGVGEGRRAVRHSWRRARKRAGVKEFPAGRAILARDSQGLCGTLQDAVGIFKDSVGILKDFVGVSRVLGEFSRVQWGISRILWGF